MGATASTHRLDPDVQAALDRLSKLLRQPKNRIINDAVKSYVRQRSRDLETELEATLNALRANRLRDPNFEDSIEAVVDAEARLAAGDPAEGRVEHTPEATARTKIQRLLDA